MQENNLYTEYTVPQKQTPGLLAKRVLFFAVCTLIPLILCLIILLNGGGMFLFLIPAILALGGAVAYYFSRYFDIEYEYSVYGESFTVSRIYAKRARKDLGTFDLRKAERVAPYRRAGYENDTALADRCNADRVLRAGSDMDGEDLYFMLIRDEGTTTLIFFEPNDKFLQILNFYCRSSLARPR